MNGRTRAHRWNELPALDDCFVLADAVLEITTAVDHELLAITAVDIGQRLFGAAAAGLFLFDGSGTFPQVVHAKGAAAGFVEEYEHGLRRVDPVLRLVRRSGRAASARCCKPQN